MRAIGKTEEALDSAWKSAYFGKDSGRYVENSPSYDDLSEDIIQIIRKNTPNFSTFCRLSTIFYS